MLIRQATWRDGLVHAVALTLAVLGLANALAPSSLLGESAAGALSSFGPLPVWAAGIGMLLLLAAAWRSTGSGLAIAGLAALLYDPLWHHVLGRPVALAAPLVGFAEGGGALGWVLGTFLTTALPVYLLSILLAERAAFAAAASGGGRLLPTLAFGLLLMGTHFGVDRPVLLAAWILFAGVLLAICLLDPEIRGQPATLLRHMARGASRFGPYLVAAAVAGLILAVLERTALPLDLAQIMAAAVGESPWLAMMLAAAIAIGMAGLMPGFAAYLIVAALIGPALRTVGVSEFATHGLVLGACTIGAAITSKRVQPPVSRQRFGATGGAGQA